MIGDPTTLNVTALTTSHVALCHVENELRQAGRTEAADAIAYADMLVLMVRHHVSNPPMPQMPIREVEPDDPVAAALVAERGARV